MSLLGNEGGGFFNDVRPPVTSGIDSGSLDPSVMGESLHPTTANTPQQEVSSTDVAPTVEMTDSRTRRESYIPLVWVVGVIGGVEAAGFVGDNPTAVKAVVASGVAVGGLYHWFAKRS